MVSRRKLARSALTVAALLAAGTTVARLKAEPSANGHVMLFPKLTAGQVLTYQIAYHSDKSAKTKSTVATSTPQSPSGTETNVRALVRLEIVGFETQGRRATIHARSYFQVMNSATHLSVPKDLPAPSDQVQRQDPKGVSIEFTINSDGHVDQIKGIDVLLPEQQQAWKEWVARFAASAAFPEGGVRIGQKWKTEELETSPTPIAKLRWQRESIYLRDEPCHISEVTVDGDVADVNPQQVPETCAVIETSAILNSIPRPKMRRPKTTNCTSFRPAALLRARTTHFCLSRRKRACWCGPLTMRTRKCR